MRNFREGELGYAGRCVRDCAGEVSVSERGACVTEASLDGDGLRWED